MWRRIYLLLLAVRLYFALAPSYIHPDEHFQGPEVIAGHVFNWPTHKTWEFTSDAPIRSFFPLWIVYGLPMKILDWIFPGTEPPKPIVIFYFLRTLFFLLSFVLEDWALQDLLITPRQRRIALTLLASSYVTWTYQTHTFSNSIETIVVLWSLVLIERISKSKSTAWLSPALLGFTAVFGTFNRITFPAFLILPAYRLIPHILKNPLSLLPLVTATILTTILAIYIDTVYYSTATLTPIITPLNNILYNSLSSNLALHGLHPRYTHLVVNIPQLLGPCIPLLLINPPNFASTPALSSLGGLLLLSSFPHQEARFLLPLVPLLLASTALPKRSWQKRLWIGAWVLFNATYGVFLGLYHQAGIVPAQTFLARNTNATQIIYWKTYNPPTWLLGSLTAHVTTMNLMGAPVTTLLETVAHVADCGAAGGEESYLAAPLSAIALDALVDSPELPFRLERMWETRMHLNMDDLEFGEDGVVKTVKRVVGRRGLGVWRIRRREC